MYYYIDKNKYPAPKELRSMIWSKGKVCPKCQNKNQKTYLLGGEYIENEGYTNFTTSKSEYYRYIRLNSDLSNPSIKCECGWQGNASELK